MATSVFWWDHKELETRSGGGQIINNHEVKMVVSLCLWILSNSDLGVGDITILTPYRAQVSAQKMEQLCEIITSLILGTLFTK